MELRDKKLNYKTFHLQVSLIFCLCYNGFLCFSYMLPLAQCNLRLLRKIMYIKLTNEKFCKRENSSIFSEEWFHVPLGINTKEAFVVHSKIFLKVFLSKVAVFSSLGIFQSVTHWQEPYIQNE